MKNIIATLLLNMLVNCLYAQYFTYFNKTYGGNDTINILAQAVRPIDDGYLVFGGYTDINGHRLYISKIDELGETVWFKDIEQDTIAPLGVIEHGGFVLEDNGALMVIFGKYLPSKDICLTKLNYNGDTIWTKCYIKPNNQIPKGIIKTLDGGYLISGMESNAAADTVSAYILKLDSMGNKQWDKAYQYGNDTRFYRGVQYYDSTYIFGAITYTTQTQYDMFVVKTQANGDTIWTKKLGGSKNDCGCVVQQKTTYAQYLNGTPATYLIAGCDYINDYVGYMYIAELDEMGNINWQKQYVEYDDERLIQGQPIIKPDGGFIAKGGYYSNNGFPAVFVMDFKANGDVNWEQYYTLGNLTNTYAQDMQPITGGYVLAGYDYNIPQTAWVFTIDTLGNTCGVPDCAETIVGVEEIVAPKPAPTFTLMPNPAQSVVTIEWLMPINSKQTGAIFDLSGKKVLSFVLEQTTTTIDVRALQTGIYYCRLDDGQTAAKLVIIK